MFVDLVFSTVSCCYCCWKISFYGSRMELLIDVSGRSTAVARGKQERPTHNSQPNILLSADSNLILRICLRSQNLIAQWVSSQVGKKKVVKSSIFKLASLMPKWPQLKYPRVFSWWQYTYATSSKTAKKPVLFHKILTRCPHKIRKNAKKHLHCFIGRIWMLNVDIKFVFFAWLGNH